MEVAFLVQDPVFINRHRTFFERVLLGGRRGQVTKNKINKKATRESNPRPSGKTTWPSTLRYMRSTYKLNIFFLLYTPLRLEALRATAWGERIPGIDQAQNAQLPTTVTYIRGAARLGLAMDNPK